MTTFSDTRDRAGSSVAVSLDAVCTWPSDAAKEWTHAAVAAAINDDSIDAIVASGSAVRDVDYADDLDLVLVYRDRSPNLPRPPIDIDLQQYERTEVADMLGSGRDYISWTVRFGQPLFQRAGWWTTLRSTWNGRLALPSAAEARARAKKTERIYSEMLAVGDDDAACELEISLLTHLARAALSDAGVYPESRPELPRQLRTIDQRDLAERLDAALRLRDA